MFLKNPLLAAALLLAAPCSAMAASQSTGYLDAYYLDASVEVEDGNSVDFDGDGFGVRGSAAIGERAFAFGEFQHAEYDRVGPLEFNIEQIRFGLGYVFSRSEQLDVYGKASYLNLELDTNLGEGSDNGWAVHGGVSFKPTRVVTLFGEIGYVDVSDLSGPEYSIGASFNVTGQFGVVASYRISDLKIDSGGDFALQDLQLGVRIGF